MRLPDWAWPHLTGDADPAPLDRDYFHSADARLLEPIERVVSSRMAQAEERVRNVETKLLALLALTSVLSAAVTASLVAAATLGTVEGGAKIFAWAAIPLVFYLATQLLLSLWTTVGGLMRRAYRQLSPADIAPTIGETNEAYRVRLLNLQVVYMSWNGWVVDGKVSQMAVAHAALRNALAATFGLIALALMIATARLL